MTPSPREIHLIDRWQRGFPLTERPFAEVGHSAGLGEDATLALFRRLRESGVITRIGAVVRPNTAGASTLAAMRVPPQQLEAAAALVSAEPLVNHNYAREHAFNLWFVVAGPGPEAVARTLARIERTVGIPALDLPLLEAYHIDLGFSLRDATIAKVSPEASVCASGDCPDADDRELLAAIEDGLPLVVRPYREVARWLRLREREVIDRLLRLSRTGVVTRFGCVVRHRRLGFAANAMAVWDVPDDEVAAAAAILARHPRVSLCYRRPRRLPDWRYNLFCMIHARTREDALAVIADLDPEEGRHPGAVLFSNRCFKQHGARFSQPTGAAA